MIQNILLSIQLVNMLLFLYLHNYILHSQYSFPLENTPVNILPSSLVWSRFIYPATLIHIVSTICLKRNKYKGKSTCLCTFRTSFKFEL